MDAIRGAKIALDNGLAGQINPVSSYLMKSPLVQVPDTQGHDELDDFIAEYAPSGDYA